MSTYQQPQPFSNAHDILARALQLVRRSLTFWPAIVVAVTLGVAAFFLAPIVVPPVYQSSAVLLYRDVIQPESLLGSSSSGSESSRARDSRLREMLLSRTTLEPIIRHEHLFNDLVETRGMVEAVEAVRLATKCQISEGGTFNISYQGQSPEQAHNVVEALAKSLVEQAKKYSADQAETTRSFLQAQLDTSATELAKAEQKLAEFLALHPEFALEQGGQANTAGAAIRAGSRDQQASLAALAMDRASDPTSTLRRQAVRLEARIRDIESGRSRPGPPTAAHSINPELTTRLENAQRNVARARENLSEKQAKFTAKHPDVVSAQAQLNMALDDLKVARSRVEAAQAQADVMRKQADDATSSNKAQAIASLKRELNQVLAALARSQSKSEDQHDDSSTIAAQNESNSIVALETEWTSVNRDAATARERNDQLQRQLFRASMMAKAQTSGDGSRIVVVDAPFKPVRPIRRGKKTIGAVAFLLVSMLGALVALGLALIDDRVFDEVDLKKLDIGPLAHEVMVLQHREQAHG